MKLIYLVRQVFCEVFSQTVLFDTTVTVLKALNNIKFKIIYVRAILSAINIQVPPLAAQDGQKEIQQKIFDIFSILMFTHYVNEQQTTIFRYILKHT